MEARCRGQVRSMSGAWHLLLRLFLEGCPGCWLAMAMQPCKHTERTECDASAVTALPPPEGLLDCEANLLHTCTRQGQAVERGAATHFYDTCSRLPGLQGLNWLPGTVQQRQLLQLTQQQEGNNQHHERRSPAARVPQAADKSEGRRAESRLLKGSGTRGAGQQAQRQHLFADPFEGGPF